MRGAGLKKFEVAKKMGTKKFQAYSVYLLFCMENTTLLAIVNHTYKKYQTESQHKAKPINVCGPIS